MCHSCLGGAELAPKLREMVLHRHQDAEEIVASVLGVVKLVVEDCSVELAAMAGLPAARSKSKALLSDAETAKDRLQ